MECVDKALARRLEAAEEMPQVHFAQLYQQTRPEINAATEPIGGGHMSFGGVGSPIGRAVGLGLDRHVTHDDLDRVEEFYRAHEAPSQIDVTPLHDVSLFEMLLHRGYAITELNNVLWRRLRPNDTFPVSTGGFEIRRGHSSEASTFADIVARCFHEHGEPPADFHQMLTPLFQMTGSIPFVASVHSVLVGAAAGLIIPEYKVVALFGAGTLPAFRRCGIQTSLLIERLKLAADAGCEIAVIVTQGGTISQRNAERLGFHVAYSKATVMKKMN